MIGALDAAERFKALRIGIDYYLKTTENLTELFDGDVLTLIIFLTLVQACEKHLVQPLSNHVDSPDGLFPDDLKRPVSVNAVATALRLPYETTRRHVTKLVEAGYCKRVAKNGVLVPTEVMQRAEMHALVQANVTNLHTMVSSLKRTGFPI